MRILIVEDDRLLGAGILAGVKQAEVQADWVEDGAAALAALQSEPFSAVVLDLGLPRLSGLEVLRELRAARNTIPVLILTARDTSQDVIAGLDAGADDYMIKPFDLGELAARLRALVRRAAGSAAPLLEHGDLQLDPAARQISWQGKPVDLAPREFAVLHELLLNAGRVLTRAQIEAKLYPWGEEVESNALEVHIHHLRKKLAPELIRTVRGVGYMVPRE
ncbi:MAG: response regulator transcription factor [Gammaproteobacteria bacterium]|nr:response regulator transcription factor [Rhodocyclaceae bacterium]MBU3910496.1 response regulator transcription factor [Gammaproteobacteria bacterium]MBU3989602.1 response regulator transcription factor [Gammaproteobacteria bacterium]MBU4004977.1 response regulator transcription factor [Gammaproteobacteria bacterium]MBU4020570.1 response regulator transcription factor [Gammaproteobacteria bacterium]